MMRSRLDVLVSEPARHKSLHFGHNAASAEIAASLTGPVPTLSSGDSMAEPLKTETRLTASTHFPGRKSD